MYAIVKVSPTTLVEMLAPPATVNVSVVELAVVVPVSPSNVWKMFWFPPVLIVVKVNVPLPLVVNTCPFDPSDILKSVNELGTVGLLFKLL